MSEYAKVVVFFLTLVVQVRSAQLLARPNDHPASRTVTDWFEEPARVFFFADIEGSGVKVFQDLWWDSFNDSRFESSDDRCHHVVHFPDEWDCGREWTAEGKQEMVARLRALEKSSVWALQFQATYPCGGVHNHSFVARETAFHPNLGMLQEAANDAGVKLHIIFMTRALDECLAMTCLRKRYDDCHSQSVTFEAEAKILRSQIDQLGSTSISCFRHYGADNMRKDIFKHFNFNTEQRVTMEHDLNEQEVTDLVDNLRRRMDWPYLLDEDGKIGQLCSTMSQLTIMDYAKILQRAKNPC